MRASVSDGGGPGDRLRSLQRTDVGLGKRRGFGRKAAVTVSSVAFRDLEQTYDDGVGDWTVPRRLFEIGVGVGRISMSMAEIHVEVDVDEVGEKDLAGSGCP